MRYKFVNLEVEDQNESGRERELTLVECQLQNSEGVSHFLLLLIMLQRITLK